MMTRKDFELVAEALHRAMNDTAMTAAQKGVEIAARELARVLPVTNSAFDRDRFLRAAGVSR